MKTIEEFRDAIIAEIYPKINKRIRSQAPVILSEIKSLFRSGIYGSDTYASLTGGGLSDRPLRGHFGFPLGQEQAIVNPVVEQFVNGLKYEFKDFTKGGGHFRIFGVPDDYFDVINLPTSNVKNDGKAGGEIPWIKWLLTAGSSSLVNARIRFADFSLNTSSKGVERNANSRSKIALMYGSGDWAVPGEFRGDNNDNWITRVIDTIMINVEEIFDRNLRI